MFGPLGRRPRKEEVSSESMTNAASGDTEENARSDFKMTYDPSHLSQTSNSTFETSLGCSNHRYSFAVCLSGQQCWEQGPGVPDALKLAGGEFSDIQAVVVSTSARGRRE
ncbi:hypothetical protein PM082_014208 [Marasmius tenuissimus]|nr:hypothetical protein PM082_014208 [Marasmius tenuissimus]